MRYKGVFIWVRVRSVPLRNDRFHLVHKQLAYTYKRFYGKWWERHVLAAYCVRCRRTVYRPRIAYTKADYALALLEALDRQEESLWKT